MDILGNTPSNDQESAYARLYGEAKRLVHLEIDNARLILTEKLTLLLGRISLVAVAFVVSATALVFLSMSVADFLLRGLEPCWTYLIIGGFYVAIVIIVACFRRVLIVDPIARYISRVILDPPSRKEEKNRSNTSAVIKPVDNKQ
ncbi:MAG: phage holin family protein [Muribaculaceae bacterium]|nr:phage holin family protein [Muribaculaceae bacterium]